MKFVQIQLHVTADHHAVRPPGQSIELLHGHLIDLVVDVQAVQVDAVLGDHVDQVVSRAVLSDQNFGIENLW